MPSQITLPLESGSTNGHSEVKTFLPLFPPLHPMSTALFGWFLGAFSLWQSSSKDCVIATEIMIYLL